MPKPPRELPRTPFAQRRLASRMVRAVDWLYHREVRRAVLRGEALPPYAPLWTPPWWRRQRKGRRPMDTSPKDQAALRPNRPAPLPRTPIAGERLWTLRKDAARMDAELRDDHGVDAGTELQLLRDGAFVYGRRHPSREMAIEEADGCRQQFEADGWQRVTT